MGGRRRRNFPGKAGPGLRIAARGCSQLGRGDTGRGVQAQRTLASAAGGARELGKEGDKGVESRRGTFLHPTLFSLEESWEGREGTANNEAGAAKVLDEKGCGSTEIQPG